MQEPIEIVVVETTNLIVTPNDAIELPEIVIIFDVETTGLIPKKSTDAVMPYITQLSYIKYNTKTCEIIEVFDSYVKIPDEVIVSELITQITGITKEMCNTGISIQTAMSAFYFACKTAECVVAHNLDFDKEIIKIEFNRNIASMIAIIPDYMLNPIFGNKNKYCTMRNSIDFCNIIRETAKGRKFKKFPKLIELYQTLFPGKDVDNLHNSYIDTLVCLRCYLKLRHGCDITDNVFEDWLVNIPIITK